MRPFFGLDGSNVRSGADAAQRLIDASKGDFSEAALFLFFQGRVDRLKVRNMFFLIFLVFVTYANFLTVIILNVKREKNPLRQPKNFRLHTYVSRISKVKHLKPCISSHSKPRTTPRTMLLRCFVLYTLCCKLKHLRSLV